MFRRRTVSLVIPAHDEEDTIKGVIEEFRGQTSLDEILVVANHCTDHTEQCARDAGARVITEEKPGYGAALMAGMRAAMGEILVLAEADGSFRARDLEKLLCYLDDANMVIGTRTTRQMVEQGANMHRALRWGNVFMAKYLELLWFWPHEPRFTDVGCTFRALTRETFAKIAPRLRSHGPAFSPEMMCVALSEGCRVIEIPVTYSPRAGGRSKHSRSLLSQLGTAFSMFRTISRKRFLRK